MGLHPTRPMQCTNCKRITHRKCKKSRIEPVFIAFFVSDSFCTAPSLDAPTCGSSPHAPRGVRSTIGARVGRGCCTHNVNMACIRFPQENAGHHRDLICWLGQPVRITVETWYTAWRMRRPASESMGLITSLPGWHQQLTMARRLPGYSGSIQISGRGQSVLL